MNGSHLVRRLLKNVKFALLFVALIVLFIGAGVGGVFVLDRQHAAKELNPGKASLPVEATSQNSTSTTISQQLTVNAPLRVNGELLLTPSTEPASAQAGQLLFDKLTKSLKYFDGAKFVDIAATTKTTNTTNTGGVTSLQGLTGAITLLSGNGIAVSGATISNNGILDIVSAPNGIGVSTAGGTATLSLPQGLSVGATPTFAGLTINGGATVTGTANITGNVTIGTSAILFGNTIRQTANGQNVNIDAGNDNIVFTVGGRTFQLPTSGSGSQTICTTGISCVAGGGQAILLAPGSAQTDNTADASIFVNDTGGGNLIQLQNNGTDRFVVSSTGDTTVAGILSTNTITPTASFTVGAFGQQFALQGSNTSTISARNGANTTTIGFVSPTANTTISFPALSAGAYQVCTSSGNCLGGGGGGANTALSNLSGVAINTSLLPGTSTIDLGSNAAPFRDLYIGASTVNNFKVTGTATATRTITVPDASGTIAVSASGNISLSAAGNITFTGQLPVGNGGTNSNTPSGARGNLGAAASGANSDITSTTALNTITPSTALTVGATSQVLALQGTSASVITGTSGGNVTTFGFTTPTASTTINLPALSAGTYTICTTSGNCLGGGSGGANTSLSNLSSVAINTSLLPGSGTIDLGSSVSPFRGVYISNTATIGTASQAGSVVLQDGNGQTATLSVGDLAANRTITIPVATVNDTICLQSLANCSGGGSGVTTVGALDGQTKSANGAVISGTSIYLQTADATNPGLVSTGTQTIAGAKTLTGNLTVTGSSLFQNSANSTTSFMIQNATGANLFTIDTTNTTINLNAFTEASGQFDSPFGGFGSFGFAAGGYGNLLEGTEDFANIAWTPTNVTVTTNTSTTPALEDNADTLTASAINGTIVQSESVYTVANTYTYSVWLKTTSGTQSVSMQIDSTAGTPTTGTAASYTVTTSWKRYSVTQTFTGSPTAIKPKLTIATNGGAVVAWGAQLVVGSSPGVYGNSDLADSTVFGAGGITARNSLALSTKYGSTGSLSLYDPSSGSGILVLQAGGADIGNGLEVLDVKGSGSIVARFRDFQYSAFVQGLQASNLLVGSTTATDTADNDLSFATGANRTLSVNAAVSGSNGNSLTVKAGNGTGTNKSGGALNLQGGTATGSGTAGAVNINANLNAVANINTGTSTGTINIGGGSSPLVVNSTNFDVSSAGDLSGITTISTSSTINSQTISSTANFTGTLAVQGATLSVGAAAVQGSLVLNDGNGGQTATLQVGNIAANSVLTLPAALGATDTFCFVTLANCSGSGVTTIGAIDGQTKSANGAVISGSSIYLQTADATNVGLVSIGTQTFAGAKTFSSNLTVTTGSITGANSDSLDIASTDATFKLVRNNVGAVTLTAADNDANADLVVKAGGTGSLTVGSTAAGSTTFLYGTIGQFYFQDGSATNHFILGSGQIFQDFSGQPNGILTDVQTTFAMTQNGAYVGSSINLSTNLTVPNTSSGNQTGYLVTLKDGGASATAKGLIVAGTADYGIDLSTLTVSAGGSGILLPATNGTTGGIQFGTDANSVNLYRSANDTLKTDDALTVVGTLTVNTIIPTGVLTVGSTGQAFTLQGTSASTITGSNGGFTTTVGFTTPTANQTYNFPNSTAGTYSICTSANNCSGLTGYIQNGTSLQSTASFNIQTGTTTNDTAVIRQLAAQTGKLLNVLRSDGTTNIFSIAGDTGAIAIRQITDSTTAFQVQNAAGTALLVADTTNSNILVNGDLDVTGAIDSPFGGIGMIGNYMSASEEFDNVAGWTATNITVTADDGASNPAPDGRTTADKLVSSASGTHTITNTRGFSIPGNGTYTYSVWLKTNSGTQPVSLRIDTTTGTPTTGTAASYTIGTTWKRYSVTQTVSGSTSDVTGVIVMTNNSATIVAWGAQMTYGTSRGAYTAVTAISPYVEQGAVVNGTLRVTNSGCTYYGDGDGNASTSFCASTLHTGNTGDFNFSTDGVNFTANGTTDTGFRVDAQNITTAGAGTLLQGSSSVAVTQSGAKKGLTLNYSTNYTVPNSANGNQTAVELTLKDGGASATATGIKLLGTYDRGIDLSGGTVSASGVAILLQSTNATTGGIQFGTDANSVNLYRSANDTLKTDDALTVVGGITVGVSDTNGTLLVLDDKTNIGDPSGTNGAMYYNSGLHEFRCYRDGYWSPCSSMPIDRGYEVSDEFLGGGTTAGTIGNQGWSLSSTGSPTIAYNTTLLPTANNPGVLKISTSAANGDGTTLTMGGPQSMIINNTNVVKATVSAGGTIANNVLRVGLHSETTANGRPVSGVWWEADSSTNANWQYCYGNGSAATCTATAVAVAATTFVRLEIRVTATGTGASAATFIINGTSASVSSVTIDTTNLVAPAIACFNSTAATRDCYVDYFQVRGDASAAR